MLEKLNYEDIPGLKGRENPNTKFAERTVSEFLGLNCDAAEVTGFPMDGCSTAAKVASLKTAIKKANSVYRVRVAQRDDRVFLVRKR